MISVIVAVARDRVIGGGNQLLWHISEDLKRFKAITTGHPVVMGRKTYESIGRPLPNRTNVIITRNKDYKAEGCLTAGSMEEAIAMFPADEEVFIIGGGEIYAQAMEIADRFYLTTVDHSYEGDTFFPEWDEKEWKLVFEQSHPHGEKYPNPFAFLNYERVR